MRWNVQQGYKEPVMKRILSAALAGLMMLSPMAVSTASADPGHNRYDHNDHHGGNFRGAPERAHNGHWARGQRLGGYAHRYPVVDYRAHRLRSPPRGYHWVRDDRGDYLLAAIATGVIASVIIANQ
jgi:Ni/Co efflux regulator RcnB